MIVLVTLFLIILFVGLLLDRKYSKEPSDNSTIRNPSMDIYDINYQKPKTYTERFPSIKHFGQWYNARFRHIKKYKKNAVKK